MRRKQLPRSLAHNIMKCAKSRKKALLKSARRSTSTLHGNWLGGPGGVTLVVSSAPRAPRRYPVHDKWGESSHGKKERERRRRRPRHDPPTAPAAAHVTRARGGRYFWENSHTRRIHVCIRCSLTWFHVDLHAPCRALKLCVNAGGAETLAKASFSESWLLLRRDLYMIIPPAITLKRR